MLGIMSDQLKTILNDERVAGSTFAGAMLALLTGAVPTPTHATLFATLSGFRPVYGGYADQAVSAWTASVLTADFHALSNAGEVTFHNSSGADTPTIMGWMLYSTVGGNRLLSAGLFSTPFVIPNGNDYKTTPSWQLTGE